MDKKFVLSVLIIQPLVITIFEVTLTNILISEKVHSLYKI